VELSINEDIRDKEVRVIDSDESMLGVMSSKDAQRIANTKNLDLVKINPVANPPVCKIMDYGKYMFEKSKKEKEAKKNQRVTTIKEVWIKPNIEDHDFEFKAKNAYKFLKDGDKVKVSVRFRGRELNYTSSGEKVLMKFADYCSEVCTVERRPKLEGKSMTMILNPISKGADKDKPKVKKAEAKADKEPEAKPVAAVEVNTENKESGQEEK